ncbi:HEAT repeat domain-containing protein [Allorhodopirellula solitaria]|nr:HEAT repeat domain-containing protein [Allorhodopirellula solitaria]
MNLTMMFRSISALALGVLLTLWAQPSRAVDPFADYDMVMYERPGFPSVLIEDVFPDGLLDLWSRALARPEVELQRMAIDSMAIAHQQGLAGVETLRPELRQILDASDQNRDLVRAAAQALIAIDSKSDADRLADAAVEYGGTVAQVIEPALGAWNSDAMKSHWLQRIGSPAASGNRLLMAIEGLGALGAEEAAPTLVEIVRQRHAAPRVRMAAARVLSQLDSSEVVGLAQSLLREDTYRQPLAAIMSIELLKRHNDDDAIELFKSLLESPNLAVQGGALSQLYRIDPEQVDQYVPRFVDSRDAAVRSVCARSMIATRKQKNIERLAVMLDDQNPSLRREVAAGLVALADQQDLKDEIQQRVFEVLRQDSWQGCEQAAVVLAKLDFKASGPRMVELLTHQRGEVKVASAWGLTQLRIEELLPAMLEHAQQIHAGFQSDRYNDEMPGLSDHVAHLFIAMGDQSYAPAAPLMRQYLPKNYSLGLHARAAAAWALGLIHEDDPPADLVTIMVGRINDVYSLEPESGAVRRMCAVSLGRMEAESALPDLREQAGTEAPASRACDWAIEKITGDPVPQFPPRQRELTGWFLSPIPTTKP